MRILVDAQLPPALQWMLSALGHRAEHVFDLGLVSAGDLKIWRHAGSIGAVIFTKDEDFAEMRRRHKSGPCVVWLRFGNTTSAALRDRLEPILPEIFEALEAGETLIEVR